MPIRCDHLGKNFSYTLLKHKVQEKFFMRWSHTWSHPWTTRRKPVFFQQSYFTSLTFPTLLTVLTVHSSVVPWTTKYYFSLPVKKRNIQQSMVVHLSQKNQSNFTKLTSVHGPNHGLLENTSLSTVPPYSFTSPQYAPLSKTSWTNQSRMLTVLDFIQCHGVLYSNI